MVNINLFNYYLTLIVFFGIGKLREAKIGRKKLRHRALASKRVQS
jgi:hypothetical protein